MEMNFTFWDEVGLLLWAAGCWCLAVGLALLGCRFWSALAFGLGGGFVFLSQALKCAPLREG